jgi:hypothetical protein
MQTVALEQEMLSNLLSSWLGSPPGVFGLALVLIVQVVPFQCETRGLTTGTPLVGMLPPIASQLVAAVQATSLKKLR